MSTGPEDGSGAEDRDPLRADLTRAGSGLPMAGAGLDELDVQLVERLRVNGRESFRSLAEATGAAEATVRKRVKRLLDDGTVQVVAIPALADDAGSLVASVRLTIAGRDPAEVAEELTSWRQTSWVATGAGPAAVLVEVMTGERDELWRVIRLMYTLEGVTHVEPTILIKTYKQLYVGPTRAQGGTENASES